MRGLGIFGIVIIVYVVTVGIYHLLAALTPKHRLVSFKKWLRKKLFYKSLLSYLLIGNLKWTVYAFGFFLLQFNQGFKSANDVPERDP